MIKTSSKQIGSAHIITIVILIVVILGTLGIVFWRNLLKTSPVESNTAQNTVGLPEPKKQKSRVVVLDDSDMNKYVNYEGNFSFLFPKQVYSTNACAGTDVQLDNYGNKVSSDFHYGVSDGPIDVTVLENKGEYIIAPKNTVVLSEPQGSDPVGYIYKSCSVLTTTTDLIDESQRDNFGVKNISLEHRSFVVKDAPDKVTALSASQSIFHDSTGTVSWSSDPQERDREVGVFNYTPDTHFTGGFAYKLWHYTSEKKIVFFALGQSVFFEHPDHSNKYYTDIVSSFKFNTK